MKSQVRSECSRTKTEQPPETAAQQQAPAPEHPAHTSRGIPACRLFLTLCLPFLMAALTPASHAQQILVLHLHDTIQPISDAYLTRGLEQAARQHAEAVIVDIDTPGGLLDSTRDMVRQILQSPVPVILYVSPSGSRAASAGFFLLEAADIAAMAPGTNTGAAHPVLEGAPLDATMKQKLENDTTAFLRSYTARRNRNTDAAQDAVLNSKSYTEREALQLHLIDLIAASHAELLAALDNRTLTRFDGSTVTLHTRNASVTALEPTLREQILDFLINPNFAVLILVLGGLLIYLEFNSPGTIVPGALGTLLVVTALFALNLLPLRYTAVMLILAAFLLLLLEAKFYSHGVLAAAGILALILGSLTLVDGPIPELRVGIATAISAGLAFGLITVFLVRLAVQARHAKSQTGPEALIGQTGTVQSLSNAGLAVQADALSAQMPESSAQPPTSLTQSANPSSRPKRSEAEGPAVPPSTSTQSPDDQREEPGEAQGPGRPVPTQILIHGELWRAVSTTPLHPGDQVRVRAVTGLTLLVDRVPNPPPTAANHPAPPAAQSTITL